MATINQAIKSCLSHPIHPKGPYIIATSGGPDSQCLLKAVSHVVGARNCIAVGIDHSLRQAAHSELDLAEALAGKCGVEFRRVSVTVSKGASLQAQTRNARYKALFKVAREIKAPFVLTGHNRDDQVETLLIKLLRGTNPKGMTFHTEFRQDEVTVVRPLLHHDRKAIMKYLTRWGVECAQDPSNQNSKYLRSWVRNELLPKMEEKSPNIRNSIGRFLSR